MTQPIGNNKPTFEVCISPVFLENYNLEDYIVVVIDVLRATTSMCVAFQNGAELIVPVETTEESMAYKSQGYLVGAERKGEKVEGFDFGNSPYSFMGENINNAKIALTTTNGTRAIKASAKANKLVVGGFVNLNALVNWLKKQNQNVLCVCSGWKTSFNLEDTLFAGALAYHLQENFELSLHRDSVLAAKHLYLISRENLSGFLKDSSHYIRLHNLNIDKDIEFCLTANQTDVVPILKDGVLYEISKLEKADAQL